MKMTVKSVPVDSLTHDPDNARLHSTRQLNAIVSSLKEFGQQRPLVVTADNVVVAGNGTLMAAKQLGWESIAVTVTPKTWTAAQVRAFAIADNRTGDLASWDNEALYDALEALNDADLLAIAGWSVAELDDLRALMEEGEEDEQEVRNQKQIRTLEELQERYANKATRQLVSDYPNNVYVWLIDRLGRIREDWGLPSNAQVISELVGRYVKEEVPEWITD